jgi:hypothetical protein
VPHGLRRQGSQDQEGAGATVQHRVVARLDEAARQGRRCHVAMACRYVGLCPWQWARALTRCCSSSQQAKIAKLHCEGSRA